MSPALAAVLGAEELRYNRRSVKELLNLAYDLAPVDRPETEQAWRATLWSGQMAALFPPAEIRRVMQGPKSGEAYVERLVPRLVRILQEQPLRAVERAEAGKALARLGDPRPGVGLRDDGLPDIAWRAVPAGPFLMGTREEDIPVLLRDVGGERHWYEWEIPQHKYEIEAPYGISRYPVTNAQYAAFVQAGGYREERYWTQAAREEVWRDGKVKAWQDDEPREGTYDYGEPFNLPNHPVVGVTWYEAVAFCRWLTEELRREGELTESQEVSLPTEPQWEKAARGGKEIPNSKLQIPNQVSKAQGPVQRPRWVENPNPGRVFPWGEGADPERANYGDTGIGTTSAVGCFPGGASPYEVEDLSGNVWEWCRTKWRDDYRDYEDDNDPQGNAPRVVRRGAFDGYARGVRCACRVGYGPVARFRNYGLRLVVSPFRRAQHGISLDAEASGL